MYKRTHVTKYLVHGKPAEEKLLEDELEKIERQVAKSSRTSQHKVLLNLATHSHGRHVRESKLETLKRLFASEGVKANKRHPARSKLANRDLRQKTEQWVLNGWVRCWLQVQGGIFLKHSSNINYKINNFLPRKSSPERRASTVSEGSLKSGLSHKVESVRFSENEIIIPRRMRALSVDVGKNPFLPARRRQSAPEVIITPAKLQNLPEVMYVSGLESDEEAVGPVKLRSSFSVSTEMCDDAHDYQLHGAQKFSVASKRNDNVETQMEMSTANSLKETESQLKSSLSGTRSKLSRGQRKSSKISSRRRTSNLQQRIEATPTEICPIKDPRFLHYISCTVLSYIFSLLFPIFLVVAILWSLIRNKEKMERQYCATEEYDC